MVHHNRFPDVRVERGKVREKNLKPAERIRREIAVRDRKVRGMIAHLPGRKFGEARAALRTIRKELIELFAEKNLETPIETLRLRAEKMMEDAREVFSQTEVWERPAKTGRVRRSHGPVAPAAAKAAAEEGEEKTLPLPAEEPEKVTIVRRRAEPDPAHDAFQQELSLMGM